MNLRGKEESTKRLNHKLLFEGIFRLSKLKASPPDVSTLTKENKQEIFWGNHADSNDSVACRND